MSAFTSWSNLDIRWRPDLQRWQVLSPIVWEVDFVGSGVRVTVPRLHFTDLASVPRPLWPVVAPFGDHAQAAVLHDYLYSHPEPWVVRGRRWADRQFLEAMEATGVPLWRRRPMWLAVRVFGWVAWRRNRL